MSKAISFLAGLGAGYFKAEDKKKEDARRDEHDARDKELYDEGKADRAAARDRLAREEADRAAIRAAAAPVDVQVTPGQAMPAEAGAPGAVASNNPTTGGYRVGANTFAERGIAQADAATQNTPEATRSRVSAAMMAQGNVLGADQLNTSGLQAKAAKMQISKAEREEANAVFDQGIKQALQTGGPQGLAKFMSEAQGGKMQFEAVMAPDGKSWQMHRVGEDGAKSPIGQTFPADENGAAMAGFMLSRSVGDDKKLAYVLATKEAERRQAHDNKSLGIQQQNANSIEQARKDTARHQRVQEGIDGARFAMAKAAHDAEMKLPPAVKAQYATYDKQLSTIATAMARAQAEGSWDIKSPGAQDLLTQQRVLVAKSQELLKPFIAQDAKTGAANDPFGIYAKTADDGGKPATKAQPSPSSPAASARAGVKAPDAAPSRQQQVQRAYDEWQRLKNANSNWWFQQGTPSDAAKAKAVADAEARYSDLLANPQSK